ncbi:MAG: glycerol-3-phosphate 1-O-acyltransferase PlsY [Candidatus Brocadiia bacterium]|nr:MAG: glycerol-3-phosphate 1-O-acyltransferase PlsY [Candidatus Brocadiia bacterium]
MKFAILIICAYLLGAVPFSFLIAKAHGIDLRKIGSGNIGATNLSRALGRKWAYLGFGLDVLKGFLPTFATIRFISRPPSITELFLWLAVGVAAVIGHVLPIYLKFRGGKGVATSFGVALGLWPYYTVCSLIVFAVWVAVVLIWRYISLASIVGAVVFPVALFAVITMNSSWDIANLWPLFTVAAAIPIMVIFLHRGNIKRLFAGTESKVLQSKKNKYN